MSKRTRVISGGLIVATAWISGWLPAQAQDVGTLPQRVLASAAIYLNEASIPAYAAGVLRCGQNRIDAAGRIRIDRREAISLNSRFNIGDNAKAMLASIAARYVERGLLRFDSQLARLWPVAAQRAPEKAEITLEMLLAHRSGLPAFTSAAERERLPAFSGAAADIRRQAAMWLLEAPLVSEPGSATLYSDAGYIVAGALLARVAGKPLEQLFEEELFVPLALDARLGSAASVDEPFGHGVVNGRVQPNLDSGARIPAFADAAGNISISAPDYAAFLQAHLCGLQGVETGYLRAATISRLHRPFRDSQASMGWSRARIAGVDSSFHISAGPDFASYVAMAPGKDFAVLALLNVGGEAAAPASSWLLAALAEIGDEDAARPANPAETDAVE